jgi:hypothetical protein
MGTVGFAISRSRRVCGLVKLLFPFIFRGNDIPETNLITKIVGNSTNTTFRSSK